MKKGNDKLIVFLMLILGMVLISVLSFGGEIVKLSPETYVCSIVERANCQNNIVLGLSSETNAHAQNNLFDQTYPYVLCCDFGTGVDLEKDCKDDLSNLILRLSSETNANAEIPNLNPNIYNENICYENAICSGKSECADDEDEILSLSSETNAHIGGAGDYSYKICCKPNFVCGDGTCDTPYETPINCEEDCGINPSAFWSYDKMTGISEAKVREEVYLGFVNTGLSENTDVIFEIYEEDALSGDDKIRTRETSNSLTAKVDSNGHVFVKWSITEADYYKTEPGDYEKFYFDIYVGETQKNYDSGYLKIINSILSPDEPESCSEYETETECKNNNIVLGIFAGTWETYQDLCHRRQNGTGCSWKESTSVCKQKTVFEFHEDNPAVCIENPLSCTYAESVTGDCSKGDDFEEIVYTADNPECPELEKKIINCENVTELKLGFFGAYNFIVTFVGIILIYFIFNRKKF